MKRVFSALDVIIIVIITSLVMSMLGGVLVYKNLDDLNTSLVRSDENLNKFVTAYGNLKDNYFEDISDKELIDGALNGMYEKVNDPYTSYLDEESNERLDNMLSGNYNGIGIEVEKVKEGIKIAKVFDNTPAKEVGLLEDDIITQVDLEDIKDKNTNEISKLISTKEMVNLTVKRGSDLLSFDVKTKVLYKEVSTYKVFENNNKTIGYISLSTFNEDSYKQFKSNLEKLEKSNIDSLIIDVRNNGGGYLSQAEKIIELFLNKGKVMYYLKTKDDLIKVKDTTSEKRKYNIGVLINSKSASASEVLAGALKYSYGATLIGDTSFGKGRVQEKLSFENTSVKYTSAFWLMPNKKNIDEKGIKPDVKIDLDKKIYNISNIDIDLQLYTAINYFS